MSCSVSMFAIRVPPYVCDATQFLNSCSLSPALNTSFRASNLHSHPLSSCSTISFQIIDFAAIISMVLGEPWMGGTEGQRLRVGHPPTFHLDSILTQSKQTGKPTTPICPV